MIPKLTLINIPYNSCYDAAVKDLAAHPTTWKELRAHELRNKPTKAERLISKPLKDLGFDRSIALYGYIADFYNPRVGLVVEIDGSSHDGREQQDAERDKHLRNRGIQTIRVTNETVYYHLPNIIARIRNAVRSLAISARRNAGDSEAHGHRAATREGNAATEATT